jgi:hypothetical protein
MRRGLEGAAPSAPFPRTFCASMYPGALPQATNELAPLALEFYRKSATPGRPCARSRAHNISLCESTNRFSAKGAIPNEPGATPQGCVIASDASAEGAI